ncbi:MAG: YbaN family protein [Spirochaetota bacterium]
MKYLFIFVGLIFIGIAYIGILLPGIPTTLPALIALWFFSKSSKRLEHWLKYNKLFGRYLRDWVSKRIYPRIGKIMMYVVLCISNIVFFTRFSPLASASFLVLTLALVFWSLPYPENQAEYDFLQKDGRTKYTLKERFRGLMVGSNSTDSNSEGK